MANSKGVRGSVVCPAPLFHRCPITSSLPVAEPVTTPRIVDTHTHFYDPTRPEGVPWPKKGSSLHRRVLPDDWDREFFGAKGAGFSERFFHANSKAAYRWTAS